MLTSPPLEQRLLSHVMIRSKLLDLIEQGHWRPGSRIDSENELAAQFKVSVGTVRKALNNLVDDGVVWRRQGSGTYVRRTQLTESQVRYYQFVKRPGDRIADISLRLLSVRLVGEGPWSAFLGPDASGYVQLRRVVLIDEDARAYTESYLPGSRFASLVDTPLQDLNAVPLYVYLEDKFGTTTLRNEHFLSTVRLPVAAVTQLRIPRRSVGTLWEFVSLALRDARIEYRRSYFGEMNFRLRLGVTDR